MKEYTCNWRRGLKFVFMAILLTVAAVLATSGPGALADSTVTFSATDDSYVRQDRANDEYGGSTTMYVRSYQECFLIWCTYYNRRTFIRFSVSSLPAGATIVSAQLKLYMDDSPGQNRAYEARRVLENWNEGTINWGNQPDTAGSGVVSPDNFTSNGWKTWDVTADVQAFYGGSATNYGWMIRDQSEGSSSDLEARFRSRDYSDTTYDPQLVVIYNRPPAAPALVSPANGAYSSDNTPLLDWNAATDPDGGDTLRYATSIDGGAWQSPSPDTQTQFTPGALGEGQHTWQVRVSDGRVETLSDIWNFTVDTDTPEIPAYLNEGSPDQDYYPNTAYSLSINWGSVPDTGSGIKYQLQRTTNGGTSWSAVLYDGPNSNFTDSASFGDNTLIEYRVRACNGASTCSGWWLSDGVLIDATNPAQVSGAGEGITAGVDDDWSRDNTYGVYWNRVADTGSGIGYEVQRSVNNGAWETFAPAGLNCDTTRCWGDDPAGHSDGDQIRYQVRAVNGAGRAGLWSAATDGIRIDLSAPDSSVTTSGIYNPITWPGQIVGTSSDGGSGVAQVHIRIYNADAGAYWSGTGWDGTADSWLLATGSTAWAYDFSTSNLLDTNTYVVDSRATDTAGNAETSYGNNNFLYATRAPEAPVPVSTSHPDPNTWYNDNQPSFSWDEPDSPIGVAGYSIQLDQYSGTIPDKIQDTTQLVYDAATTPDGTWYFHVRAVDITGQWGPAGHVRVNIDTTTPQAPAGVTEGNPDVDWHANGAVTVYWTAVPNTGSGISYSLERCVNGGLSGACTSSWLPVQSGLAVTSYADNPGGYSDGNTVRYRVRATNGVGLNGNWTVSDGLTIDSDTPGQPAWVYEDATAEPDRDFHSSANGAVTVYWASVPNTGSGITYRLEKSMNSGGWMLVAEGLGGNSYADSGSYSDGDQVVYRVTAFNGVGQTGAARASDGFTIDLGIPALPAWVREGVATDPDSDFDGDGSFSVYWASVPNTGSGITYRLEKSIDDGAWVLVDEALADPQYADTNLGITDGAAIRYRVTPTNGAGISGPYRLSDGIVIDLDAPQAPATITENSPDVDFDPDGAVIVYWTGVTNTGSGVSYDLQKRINGGDWTNRATGLAVTSFNDSATFADETFIEYRVFARNGVGRISAAATSDGVRVDNGTPATPTGIGEGDVAGTDDDFDENNTFFVYWTPVPPTATGDQTRYTVERNVNGGGWSVAATGLTVTAWDDPNAYSNGDQVAYQVSAVNGAGASSPASTASDGITIDTGLPNSTITTAGYYNAVSWPDRIEGTASDDYSDLARVELTIYNSNTNLWWNGTAWTGGGPFWLLANGTANWTYSLPDTQLSNGHNYDLQSRATDRAGNRESETSLGTSSFIFANSGPQAPVVSSTSHPNQAGWYNDNDPDFSWDPPGGPAPIVGYSYILDQNPATTPDTTVDSTGTGAAYLDLADGAWYFHVRALDNAETWGPAGHYRINIDTATPAGPASVTDESPDIDWDFDGSISVYWTAVADTGSGITYIVERQVDSGNWAVLDGNVQSTVFLDAATGHTDGTVIRYRVSARNGVGLTGPATPSDGFTVDSDSPASPAWVTENAPDPGDQDVDADGSVRVYWAASNNTGSGLSYSLERRITVGGTPGPWTIIATGLTGTSYLDPLTHTDSEFIEYRVTAVNGVGSFNPAAVSDGIRIDTDTPAAPAEVTENSPDIDWSLNGSVTVFWGGVGDTGTGIGYRLEKQVNTGAWNLVPGAGNLPGGTTSFADSGSYNDGDLVRYRVRATNGAGTAGAWRESDGMRIDSNTPVAPAWVREENPDIDFDSDGILTVYWAAVTDTGSGLTYRLEKELNNSGAWSLVVQGLAGSSFYDGQTQPDGTIVRYRVTAVNGVGTTGTPTTSDNVTVDTQVPAAPVAVGEGDVAGTDDAFDQDNSFYVFWNAVTSTGSGISYVIEKSLNGGTWVAAGSGVVETFWEDPVPYSNGDTIQYRVRAVSGAGVEGPWAVASSGLTMDFIRPDSTVSTGGYYNAFNWPGAIFGTASDTGSDVQIVHLTIQRASDSQYWTGSGWQADAAWLPATGTINWQVAFTPANGETYDIRSRATDYAGNVELTYGVGSFTFSSSGPQAPEISSSTHPDETAWYANGSPAFAWTEPSSVAPVAGYSYILDRNPGTTPDAVADTTNNSAAYSNLADGIWYFHVRALDDANNWGPADHFAVRIDTGTPAAPAAITEETPDIDFDADGSFSVYWSSVADTGSGITYRLERELDHSGSWALVTTTPDTRAADSGSYADNTLVRYRVRAFNGVGSTSGWAVSDGVRIDLELPAAPVYVREGVATDPDWDWDADGAYPVYWSASPDTGSGIRYQVYQRVNGGAWQFLVDTANTSYNAGGVYPDNTLLEYQVIAVNGAASASTPALSNGIRIDSDTPAATAFVTEESPDVDWDLDGALTVHWGAVPNTGSGITYRLERNLNGTGWAAVTVTGVTSYSDTIGNIDGTFAQYRVTVLNGVGAEGAPRVSDGVTVDSQAVQQPAWVREDSLTDPDRDYYPATDGAITVYWAPVSETGSGIRYQLEKRVNGGAWTLVAANLLSTSYPDSGAYVDGDFIEYRVTAINGVLTQSLARVSDGMWIDTGTPDAPTAVGEGDAAGTDDDFDENNVFLVFWTAPDNTGSGLRYTVERSRNGGAWEQAAVDLACSTVPCQWDDPVPYSNGDTVQYRLIAINNAGLASEPSLPSDGITLDFAQPDSAITTGGYYNAFNWPGFIQGTAADAISDVDFVDLTLHDTTSNRYWDGATWQVSPAWLRTTGTLNWQFALVSANLADGHTYDLRSRATDRAGNVEATWGPGSFTYAASGPQAPVITSSTHPNQATWYNNNDPVLNWTVPALGVGIQGYSYILDQLPGTTPDTTLDTAATTLSYPDVADGSWYFHVRVQDNGGNWGPAGHYRLNIDTTTPTAPPGVTEESPDIDWDGDGSVRVIWGAVPNTGSGITYRLEQNLNSGGWTLVGEGLSATSGYTLGGYADGDNVLFRVQAINGVGLAGGFTESDGVRFDLSTPPAPINVGEGDSAGADDDWDQDNVFYVFWDAVPAAPSGIVYTVERSRNGGAWELMASGLAPAEWEDPTPYTTGDTVVYRVRATTGAGRSSPISAPSDGLTLDFVRPDSTVQTSGSYNVFTWPGDIEGIATDDLSDVALVEITIRRLTDNLYWDGAANWVANPAWLPATGSGNWQYAFTPDDGRSYQVQSRATDNADNVETTLGIGTFTYTSNEVGIVLNDGRTTVQPGQLITYTLTFSSSFPLYGGQAQVDIPAHTTFVEASPATLPPADNRVLWNLGLLANPVYQQRRMVVRLDPVLDNGTIISTTALINSGAYQNWTDDNAVVSSSPDLTPSALSVSNTAAPAGEQVTYRIVLTNAGTMHAYHTTLTDTLPAELIYEGNLAASQGTPAFAGGRVGWSGEVRVGSPVEITFDARIAETVPAGTNIENTIEIHDGIQTGAIRLSSSIITGRKIQTIYLPLVTQNDGVTEPTEPEIKLTIRNCGETNAVGAFWVDLYIDPDESLPWWPISHGEGFDWFGSGAGFTVSSLGPGQSLTLYLADAVVKDVPDNLAGVKLYAQVDWVDKTTPGIGAVYEGPAGETNNVAASTGNLCQATPGLPDLVVESIQVINVSVQGVQGRPATTMGEPAPVRPAPSQSR